MAWIDSHIPQIQQHEKEIIINLCIKYLDILIIPCFFLSPKGRKRYKSKLHLKRF